MNIPERILFHTPTKNNQSYREKVKSKGCYGMHICDGG